MPRFPDPVTIPETAFVCDELNGGRKNPDGTVHWNNYGAHPPVVVAELIKRIASANLADKFVAQEGKADDDALRKLIAGNPRFLGAIVWVIGHPGPRGTRHVVNERGMVLGEHVRFVEPALASVGRFQIWDPETGKRPSRQQRRRGTGPVFLSCCRGFCQVTLPSFGRRHRDAKVFFSFLFLLIIVSSSFSDSDPAQVKDLSPTRISPDGMSGRTAGYQVGAFSDQANARLFSKRWDKRISTGRSTPRWSTTTVLGCHRPILRYPIREHPAKIVRRGISVVAVKSK